MTDQERTEDLTPVPAEIEGGNTTYWYVCGECHSIINPGDKICNVCKRPVIWE